MAENGSNTHILSSNEVRLHVEDTGGTGRPILLVHGWPLSGASWADQVPVLRDAGYRVITYDRRGFGESDKPKSGYDYDTFTDDLRGLIEALELSEVTLVGFSMGGGEVARYIAKYGEDGLHSAIFAAAIPPKLLKSGDNPEGPLDREQANSMAAALMADENAFYDNFMTQFFSANGDGHVLISEEERQEALSLCKQADKTAALASMEAFGQADFRDDLTKITVPTLVIHGDADGVVPFEGSGKRTHETVMQSELHVIKGGPHGINVSHKDEFNKVLLGFLKK